MPDWYSLSLNVPKSSIDKDEANRLSKSLAFESRRSPILCRNGCVSSSQPLASSIGIQVMREMGGNAADAAVAVAAALAVLEPCSTGLGGDMFLLHFSGETNEVSCVNGSGKSPADLTIDLVRRDCGCGDALEDNFRFSPHAVTVPGAAMGWEDTVKLYGSGKLTLSEILEPAALLADQGFPVAPLTAYFWGESMDLLKRWSSTDDRGDARHIPLSIEGNAPKAGDIFSNPDMANVLRSLGANGAMEGFYNSWPGEEICKAVQQHGGVMTRSDLSNHRSTFPKPIHADYRGVRMWQAPPNGQGVAGLIALIGVAELERAGTIDMSSSSSSSDNEAERLHAMIEMMRLGFADAKDYVCDPDYSEPKKHSSRSIEWLLDAERIGKRATHHFDPNNAVVQGLPVSTNCTVSFQVVDQTGDAVSFVNSNYMGFGTGIVPNRCGFTLQNRGAGFVLQDMEHPNCLMPGKRPLHTILPSILTHADTGELYASFTNMGGQMQPQGHLQHVVNMVARGMDPQAAVDRPRFCIVDGTKGGTVSLEEGFDQDVVRSLTERGHRIVPHVSGYERVVFGRAQVIKRDRRTGVLWAGSDGRADGCAIGY